MRLTFSEPDPHTGTIHEEVYMYDIASSTPNTIADIPLKFAKGIFFEGDFEYTLTATDYTSYAVLYKCNDALHMPAQVIILTRSNSAEFSAKLRATITKGICATAKYFNADWIRNVTQGPDCVYA